MSREFFRLGYTVQMMAGSTDTAEVMLYGEIIDDMPEPWKWSKEDKSAADFNKAIKKVLDDGARNLLLRINSPGGICTEAVAMRAILTAAGFENIDIRIEGLCASAATILATLPGAHVIISEGSEYMIHNPMGGVYGTAAQIQSYADRIGKIEQTIRGFYTGRTGQTDEQAKAWMDAETWFTAEEAVKYGFADEVLKATAENEIPAAACVSSRVMCAMRNLYQSVPEQIATAKEDGGDPAGNSVSNGAPVAGVSTEINNTEEEHPSMEINEITAEQLQGQNPTLYQQIAQEAVAAERQRIEDIDALTLPGYEDMAANAKANGTSAMDFQREIVKAQRQKGKDFLANRQKETASAKNVSGGTPGGSTGGEDEEIKANAKDIAAYAANFIGGDAGGMF